MPPRTRRRRALQESFLIDAALALGLGALATVLMVLRHRSFFDAFDYSGFIDVFYRIARGQQIYVDFLYNTGPVHPFIGGTLFRIFGPGPTAIAVDAALISFSATGLAYAIARRELGRPAAAGLAALAGLYFVGPLSFPVYDHHAWLFALAALAVARARLAAEPRVDAAARGFACGLLVALSFFSKSNVGAIVGVVVAAVLALEPLRARAAGWLALGFVFCVNAIIFLLGTPYEFLHGTFVEYAPMSRLTRFSLLLSALHTTPYLPLGLVGAALAAYGGREFVWRNRRDFVIFFGLLGAALFAIFTASMLHDLNNFALGFAFIYLVLLAWRLPAGTPRSIERRVRDASLVALALVGAFTFFTGVERTARIGPYADRLTDLTGNTYRIKSPPFTGWLCRPEICGPMDEVVSYLKEHARPSDSLFVFPDMQIIYLLTGLESYRQAPFQFVLNELPAPGQPTVRFLNHFDADPPRWVVVHDINYMPAPPVHTGLQLKQLQLDQYFARNYTRAFKSGAYEVLVHRGVKEAPRK